MIAVEFRSVTKVYRTRRAIDSLSFTIEAGERVVLFGPSGRREIDHADVDGRAGCA